MRKPGLFALALPLLTMAMAAHAQLSVLYDFGSHAGDPVTPGGVIAQGRDGNLYSTTPGGGANNCGAAFKITPAGSLTTLYSFAGNSPNGELPYGGLTLATDGNFYGTTEGYAIFGPCNGLRYTSVFKVTPQGKITALLSSSNVAPEPFAPPIQGTDGNFYGTTFQGDFGNSTTIDGSIYKIAPSGALTTLYNFDITHGSGPMAPLVEGTDGNFYGTTTSGGIHNNGVIFKITPAGKFTVLYNFDITHGAAPNSPLIQASDGNFYGTASSGGSASSGVVFKITPGGTLTVLHSMNGTTEGGFTSGGLTQATDGNFYGVNSGGGSSAVCSGGCGTLFSIKPGGAFTVLHSFDGTTGANPRSTPFQSTNGVIYGVTAAGGTGNPSACGGGALGCGVFYRWSSAGLRPFVSLLPGSGKVGATIEFLGQNFKGTKSVSFNGIAARFVVQSGTYLTATVPKGATTGFVTVTTSQGTLKSNKTFRVIP